MSHQPIPKRPPTFASHLGAVARKEALHILRSPRELVLILVMPGLLTFLFGYAFEVGEVRGIATLVVDEDGSSLSKRWIEAMRRDPTFTVEEGSVTVEAAKTAMDRDRYQVVVRIPAGTERRARGMGSAPVTVTLSGIDTVSGPTAMRSLTRIGMEEGGKLLALRMARLGLDSPDLAQTLRPVSLEFDVRYNPSFRFIRYVMPGILGLILQLLTVGLMAGAITREKELGTFEALLASPVRPLALLLGKTLPYFAVSLLEVGTILAIARWGFGVSLGRSAVSALGLTLLFVVASLATGLLISTLTRTQGQSMQLTVLYCLPVFMLSGAYAPLNIIPPDVRWISWLFPLTYFCRAFRDLSLKELALLDVGRDVGLLAVYIVLAIVASGKLIRKRVA